MKFRTLNDTSLSDFAENVRNLLRGMQLEAIDPAVRTQLETAIGTLPNDLANQAAASAIAEDERKASVSTKNFTRGRVIALMAQVRDALKAGLAPKKQYDLCGFDYPLEPVGTYEAQNPTQLSAIGFSNGVNKIKFTGNNKPNSVVYEIWRRQSDTAPWSLHATTTRQSFEDKPATPGQYYEYKLRAVAANSDSNFSNTAVVYGRA